MVDQGSEPGEQSLDNQGVWGRTQWDFVLGAGQTYFDEVDESTRRRHRVSRNVDVLSGRRQVTTLKKPSLATTLTGSGVGARIIRTPSNFWISNQSGSLVRTASLTSFTTTNITGSPAAAPVALVHFGSNVYVAFGTSGIYRGTVTGSSISSWFATNCTLLAVAHG